MYVFYIDMHVDLWYTFSVKTINNERLVFNGTKAS